MKPNDYGFSRIRAEMLVSFLLKSIFVIFYMTVQDYDDSKPLYFFSQGPKLSRMWSKWAWTWPFCLFSQNLLIGFFWLFACSSREPWVFKFIGGTFFVENSSLLKIWTNFPKSTQYCHFCRTLETSLKQFFFKCVCKIFLVIFSKVYHHEYSNGLSQTFLFAQTRVKIKRVKMSLTLPLSLFRRSSGSSFNKKHYVGKKIAQKGVVCIWVSEGKLQGSETELKILQISTHYEDDDSKIFRVE